MDNPRNELNQIYKRHRVPPAEGPGPELILTDAEAQWLLALATRLDVADDDYRKQVIKKLKKYRGLDSKGENNVEKRYRIRKTASGNGSGAGAEEACDESARDPGSGEDEQVGSEC